MKRIFRAFLKESLKKFLLRFKLSDWVLIAIMAFYSIIFSYYTIMRHYSFRSDAWDLGLIVQSLASAIRGRLFTNNVELFFSPNGSYFGVHFAPVLFLVVPFFYFIQSVETVLVLQSVVLALGAIPVYLIAVDALDDRISALFIAAAYLLNPLLQGVNWYDFHTQAFFPLFMLLATYFLRKKRIIYYMIFLLLGLSTIEQAAYFTLAYVPYTLSFLNAKVVIEACRKIRFKNLLHLILAPLLTLTISMAWIILSSTIKGAINPNPPQEIKASSKFELLDVGDPSEIPIKVIFNPSLALAALQYDLPKKVFYIVITLASSCFLALLSPLALIPVFLWLFVAALSNWTPYYSLGFQYPSFTLPFIYVALIDAMRKMFSGFDREMFRVLVRKFSTFILLVGITLAFFLSPISFVHEVGRYDYFRDYGVTTPSIIENHVRRVIIGIPKEPFVLATSRVFPHLAMNPNAYTIPPINNPSPELFKSFIERLKNSVEFDYILIVSFWNKDEANLIYTEFIKPSKDYGLLVRGPGLELYKRGYKGLAENISIRFTFKELYATNVIIVNDPSSETGKAMMFKVSQASTKVIWYGPYVALPPGKYTAHFRIKVDQVLTGKLIDLEVYSRDVDRIALRSVKFEEISEPSSWQTFSITFTLEDRIGDVEFRGLNPGNNVTIFLDYIEVVPE